MQQCSLCDYDLCPSCDAIIGLSCTSRYDFFTAPELYQQYRRLHLYHDMGEKKERAANIASRLGSAYAARAWNSYGKASFKRHVHKTVQPTHMLLLTACLKPQPGAYQQGASLRVHMYTHKLMHTHTHTHMPLLHMQ